MRRLRTLLVVAGLGLGLAACEPSSDCGRVLTQDTTLRADVLNCPGDGLVIGADGIEVRLAGHTIDGTSSQGSAGIRVAGHHDVVLRGPGLVKEFDDGVRVEDGTGNAVRNVTVTANSVGIHLIRADGGRVVANDVSSNEASLSSHVPPAGVLLEDADRNLLSGNTVFEDDFSCIQLIRSHRNRIVGNAANHADGTNISLTESHDNELLRNDATTSNGDAISLSMSDGNLVEGNDVGNTSTAGIGLGGSARNRVIANVGVENGTAGVELRDSSHNLVEGNYFTAPDIDGIEVRTSSGSSTGNRLRFNTVGGGEGDGIVVTAAATDTVLRANTTNDNSDDGIDVDAPSTTLRDNVANDNGDLGIEAVVGVTDGGGNRASGNGNPAQCTGVACT